MSTGGYPLGAQYDPRAPYNEKPNAPIEIEVEVEALIKKKVTIKVDDYTAIAKTFYKETDYDFDTCDLRTAVQEQVKFPEEWELVEINAELP